MAKADVQLKFDAQTNEYVQACLKARDASVQAADGARKFGDTAAKSSNVASEAMKSAGGSIISYFGIVTTAAAAGSAAVKFIISSTEEYLNKMEAKADKLRGKVATLSGSMAGSGSLQQFGQVNQQLKAMGKNSYNGLTVGGLGDVYAKLNDKFKGKVDDPKVILRGVEEYQKSVGAGMSEEDALSVAEKRVMLSPMGLEDMAFAAHKGGLDESDMRIVYRAKDKKQALKMVLASKRVEEGGKTLAAVGAEAERTHKSVEDVLAHPSSRLTKDAKMKAAIQNLQRGMAAMPDEKTTAQVLEEATHISDKDLDARKFEQQTEQLEKQTKGRNADKARDFLDQRDRRRAELRNFLPDWVPDKVSNYGSDLAPSPALPPLPKGDFAGSNAEILAAIQQGNEDRRQQNANTALKNNSEGQK